MNDNMKEDVLRVLLSEDEIREKVRELGGKITVKAFTRFATGEGIEKAEENFAAEVASMIK